ALLQSAAPAVLIAFADPLPGAEIDSPFGLRQLPWEGAGRLHAGIDLLAPAGAHVLAAADGVVIRAGQDPGYGRFIEVKHAEGLTTRYAHMARFEPAVTAGLAVKAGTPIGFVGSTGSSTGPHLHFEIRDRDDRPLNPEVFLGRSFASAADLPLREALRPPHGGVRLAHVSNIPASKRALMEARLRPEVRHIDPAVQRRIDAETARRVAASFGETAEAAATASNPRPHMRLHPKSSPEAALSLGPLPAG
ncbi:MAG TPA: M23 family metallopeptidase, partial [Phenylobacterium sp.]|nr:M23 family metallopeptidase [Phenylobacterium sp.]